MASVLLITTWHVEASEHLDYFRLAVWRHFIDLLCNFYCLSSSHVVSICIMFC